MENLRFLGKTILNNVAVKNATLLEEAVYDYLSKSNVSNFDVIYKQTIYQIINDALLEKKDIDVLLQDIKIGKINWNHDQFTSLKNIEYEQDQFIIQPFEIIEGIAVCNCGSKRVYSYSKQTRSGDESCTTFNECLKCKAKWVYSG
jgi:DNA-directed RNA polymerase subunit M/transcription elongation factor TFIIS